MSSSSKVPTTNEVKDKAAAQADSVTETGEQVLDELVNENGESCEIVGRESCS
jgi:hypothetical protein